MDNRLRIVIPQKFTVNGSFDLQGFIDYLQTEGSTFIFEYNHENKNKKGFINWWKDVINITKEYLK